MKDNLEYISEFAKQNAGDQKFEPLADMKRFKKRLSWHNFFKAGWSHFNIYYCAAVISLVCGGIMLSSNYPNNNVSSHHPVTDTIEKVNMIEPPVTQKKQKNIEDSISNNKSKELDKKAPDNQPTITKKTNANEKKNENKRNKDTVKVVIHDTVVKRIRVQVVDTVD